MESCLNSRSYVLLCCHDEEGTEDDEGEAEAIFDEDVVKLILVCVSKDQVDVIVGDVDEDKSGKKKERTKRYSSWSAARREGQTDQADDEGGEGSEDGGDVDGEVERYLVEEVVWFRSDWAECEVCVESGGLRIKSFYEIGFLIMASFCDFPRFIFSAEHLK